MFANQKANASRKAKFWDHGGESLRKVNNNADYKALGSQKMHNEYITCTQITATRNEMYTEESIYQKRSKFNSKATGTQIIMPRCLMNVQNMHRNACPQAVLRATECIFKVFDTHVNTTRRCQRKHTMKS